ncbi:MAG TPA: N-acetylmuramoyl-L-alanine amidase [Chthoniobacterales bacterium]|nr:N-acetylmuramoyl-L-alanine amidase [Chthoniobacterales bacterium]
MDRERGRSILAWLGLLLMVASFVWLQLLPRRDTFPEPTQEPAREQPFAVVVIDPGHGGLDSGTMKAGMIEKDLTLDVARRAERLLQSRGLVTLLTRADDSYISLAARAAIANEQPNCIFISIHFDEAGRSAATGIETYYAARQGSIPERLMSWLPFLQKASLESTNSESQSLASFIQEELVVHTQAVNRGTRPEQFFVIANVRHPAVLVEGGFLTNKDDVSKLGTEDYREQIAAAISDGVVRYRDVLQQQRTPLVVNLPGR